MPTRCWIPKTVTVALRKESVDRNRCWVLSDIITPLVALRKESVDRNLCIEKRDRADYKSLSARRAWIEILIAITPSNFSNVALRKESVDRNRISWDLVGFYSVALRKESVDRNNLSTPTGQTSSRSLSARRAWIEIGAYPPDGSGPQGRSPQGERG